MRGGPLQCSGYATKQEELIMTTTTFQDIGFGSGKLQKDSRKDLPRPGFWARLFKTLVQSREGEIKRRVAMREFDHLSNATLKDIGIEPGSFRGLPPSVRAELSSHC
jgi:hypothetical protein